MSTGWAEKPSQAPASDVKRPSLVSSANWRPVGGSVESAWSWGWGFAGQGLSRPASFFHLLWQTHWAQQMSSGSQWQKGSLLSRPVQSRMTLDLGWANGLLLAGGCSQVGSGLGKKKTHKQLTKHTGSIIWNTSKHPETISQSLDKLLLEKLPKSSLQEDPN